MTPEMKTQVRGLTVVGIIIAAGAITAGFWFKDMTDNSLMSASPKYHATIPAVPKVDITQAPQCADGYDKKWIGCQSLAQ